MNEPGLVEAFLAGDERAFNALYDRHTPKLYQFALRLVGGRERDAEEVVQETWLRATERIATFAWRSTLSTWLLGIALNCARELVRRNGSAAERSVAHADPPAAVRPFRAESIDLERAITRLPGDFRLVLVLHDVEGFTHPEIAERLGIEQGTSKSRLSRARALVRAALRTGEDT